MLPLPEKYIFHFLEPNQFELSRKNALRLFSKEDIEENAVPIWDQKDFPDEEESENSSYTEMDLEKEASLLGLHEIMALSKFSSKIDPGSRNDIFDLYLLSLSKYLNKYFKSGRFENPSDLLITMVNSAIKMPKDDDEIHRILRKIALFIWHKMQRR